MMGVGRREWFIGKASTYNGSQVLREREGR
jgi:hypothetical protein